MSRTVRTLDLTGVEDKAGLMERCARDLALPGWFGRNWDALADVLTDPDLWPRGDGEDESTAGGGATASGSDRAAAGADEGPVVLVRNWQAYAEARPREWRTACEVFAGATEVTVALVLGGSSEQGPDQL
jgi:hypothetical protein